MTTRRRAAAAGGNSSAAKTARIEMVEMSEFDMGMGIKEEPLSLFNFVDVNDCVEPSANKTNTPISTNQYPDSNINFHENIKVIAEIMQKLLDKMEHHEVETDRRFTVQNILMNKIIKQNEKLLNTSRQERIEHGSAALDNLLDAELASLNEPTTNPQAAKETPRGLTNTQIIAPESTQPPHKSLSSMPVKKNVKPVTITTTNGNVLQKVNLAEVLGTANSSASLKKITELTQKVDQLNNSILEIKKMEVLNYGAFNMNTSNQINSEFPLDSVEAVLKMEKSLADEQKYIEVRNMFNCYSESLEKKFKAMFSDNSIKNFTYNGFMDLLPLSSNKRLMEILKSTTNIICTQFEREVSSFIIRAKGRLKKKKSRNRDVFHVPTSLDSKLEKILDGISVLKIEQDNIKREQESITQIMPHILSKLSSLTSASITEEESLAFTISESRSIRQASPQFTSSEPTVKIEESPTLTTTDNTSTTSVSALTTRAKTRRTPTWTSPPPTPAQSSLQKFKSKIPLTTIQDLDIIEEILMKKQNVHEIQQYCCEISKYSDLHSLFKKIFADKLLLHYNFYGKKNKEALTKYKIIKILFNASLITWDEFVTQINLPTRSNQPPPLRPFNKARKTLVQELQRNISPEVEIIEDSHCTQCHDKIKLLTDEMQALRGEMDEVKGIVLKVLARQHQLPRCSIDAVDNRIKESFPLTTVEGILQMEKSLSSEETYTEVSHYFNILEGKLEQKFRGMFSDAVLRNYTLTGIANLPALNAHKHLMQILKNTTNYNEVLFSSYLRNFIKSAKNRLNCRRQRTGNTTD